LLAKKTEKKYKYSILKNIFGKLRLQKEIPKLDLPAHAVVKSLDKGHHEFLSVCGPQKKKPMI